MKKVFIKYNPYKLETELTIDGNGLAENSKIGECIVDGTRLQEWIEDFPRILVEEYNDVNFDIVFHGTLLDYEDLSEVFERAKEKGVLKAQIKRIPAKETIDKEVLIDKLFEQIQKGPFDELRAEEITSSFEHAKSSDFEVCVVATMSAGKSTLINSMLGDKLMPSKQEACTAIITRIKDVDNRNTWQAEVYDSNNVLIETTNNLTYNSMERLNSDENVSIIKAFGNIPFVTSEDVSLVLIDTPGPNNSRDPEHKRIQSEFLNKSSKSLVLYIMEGTFGSDDDNALLQRVADSMKVGGKQSKDRFIFVVNKMDDRRKEDGDIEQTLNRIRTYLKGHGIENPNLFPAAALPALNIRLIQNGVDIDEDTLDETEVKVKKLNRNEGMHFENYATLPASVNSEIRMKLSEAQNNDDVNAEALVHTGVVSIEAAIRQYVQKYAKTAKIKNIVDTFMHKLDEVGCFEKTKQELAKNRENSEQIVRQIEVIRQKVDDANSAKMFKESVDKALVKVNNDIEDYIDEVIEKYQCKLTAKIDVARGREIEVSKVMDEVEALKKFVLKLTPDLQTELDEMIRKNLVSTSNTLLEEYVKKLSSFNSEVDLNTLVSIKIEPLKLMSGSTVSFDKNSIGKLTLTKRVENGREWVENTSKAWWKPWTWLDDDGYYRTLYKDVKYVRANELAQEFFASVQENLISNGNAAQKHTTNEANKIVTSFKNEFVRLDKVLKDKLAELETYAKDKENAEERIKKTEQRLAWLEQIKRSVAAILDI